MEMPRGAVAESDRIVGQEERRDGTSNILVVFHLVHIIISGSLNLLGKYGFNKT